MNNNQPLVETLDRLRPLLLQPEPGLASYQAAVGRLAGELLPELVRLAGRELECPDCCARLALTAGGLRLLEHVV